MTARLRIGAIGAGRNMANRLRILAERPEVEIVALCDPSAASLEHLRATVAATASAAVFADHHAMLAGVALDGVVVSTPHTLHHGQVMAALDRGLHVLCEKPLACSVRETEEIVARARERDRVVVVGYQRRFQGGFAAVRDFVRDPAFGTPLFVQAYQSQHWYQQFRDAWRTDPALSGGGQINDSGSHLIDVLCWILPSPPVEVCALMERRGTRVDVDSAISFRCADGCLGSLAIHGSGPRVPGMVETVSITGSSGRAVWLRPGELKATRDGELVGLTGLAPDGNKDHHWIDVILGRAANRSPPEDFLPTIAFTEACWASAARGGAPVAVAQPVASGR